MGPCPMPKGFAGHKLRMTEGAEHLACFHCHQTWRIEVGQLVPTYPEEKPDGQAS